MSSNCNFKFDYASGFNGFLLVNDFNNRNGVVVTEIELMYRRGIPVSQIAEIYQTDAKLLKKQLKVALEENFTSKHK